MADEGDRATATVAESRAPALLTFSGNSHPQPVCSQRRSHLQMRPPLAIPTMRRAEMVRESVRHRMTRACALTLSSSSSAPAATLIRPRAPL
eukprot:scaffold225641_cov30-Tisochrysis_lutea.AAC.6